MKREIDICFREREPFLTKIPVITEVGKLSHFLISSPFLKSRICSGSRILIVFNGIALAGL